MCLLKLSYLCAYTHRLGCSLFPRGQSPFWRSGSSSHLLPLKEQARTEGQQSLTSKHFGNLC